MAEKRASRQKNRGIRRSKWWKSRTFADSHTHYSGVYDVGDAKKLTCDTFPSVRPQKQTSQKDDAQYLPVKVWDNCKHRNNPRFKKLRLLPGSCYRIETWAYASEFIRPILVHDTAVISHTQHATEVNDFACLW